MSQAQAARSREFLEMSLFVIDCPWFCTAFCRPRFAPPRLEQVAALQLLDNETAVD
jgi:hypothetical protein